MNKLRLVKIFCNYHDDLMRKEHNVLLSKDIDFPQNLKYLHWQGCNLRFLPSKFHGEHLIKINLKSSNLIQLWKDNKV